MENVIHYLTLDLTGPDLCPVIEVQRGDSARSLIISLTQGGRPYWIDEGLTAALFATKPDGNPLFNACTIEKNRIRYDFTPQTVNVAGTYDCEIWLVAGDKRELTTPRFTIAVDERMRTDDVIPESAPEYTAITEMVAAGTAMIEELREALAGLEGVGEILTQARAAAARAAQDAKAANQAANTAGGYAAAAGSHAKTAADAAEAARTLADKVYASEQAAVTAAGDAQVRAETAQGFALQAEGAAVGAAASAESALGAARDVTAAITQHDSSTKAHSDLRLELQALRGYVTTLLDSDDTTLDQLSEIVGYIKSNRTLIEAVTTGKVSVGDIVNDLTTNVPGKPLSAAMGVELAARIGALAARVAVTAADAGALAMVREDGSLGPVAVGDNLEVRDGRLNATGGGSVGGGSGQNQTQEVTVSVAVGSDPVTLDGTAPEQVVNLAWQVQDARTIPAFANYFVAKSSIPYPRELKTGFNQFWSATAGHGNADAFDASHKYFCAIRYEMDGDSSAEFNGGSQHQTPTGTNALTGSGWVYGFKSITAAGAGTWYINNLTGSGRVTAAYCIDVTAMQEAGVIAADTTAELVEVFGGLDLIPGQDYPGGTIGDGTATLSINRGGEISTVDNTVSTATVKGGDILSVEGGSVAFMLTILQPVNTSGGADWTGIKWVAFGDSLTDGSINADVKYHKLIAERTGITVVDMGKGGTGYWATNDSGTAFYQRMANVPADADIITILGSVNDWKTRNNNVEIGTASDTIEAGTLAGYINECIDVAIAKAPYAQIALITPMDYHGLPDDTLEAIANIIVAVAKHRKIKCLDLCHESGFRVDDPVFAQAYCTDYDASADAYGHPSNLAHERIIAPEFMELLRRMIF